MAFHEFSQSLGRLSRATRLQPLFPIRPVPLSKADSVIIYDSIKTRPASTDVQIPDPKKSTLPEYVAKFQRHCAANIDKDTYLIRGTSDKVLFGVSVAGVVIGLGMSFEFLWDYIWIK